MSNRTISTHRRLRVGLLALAGAATLVFGSANGQAVSPPATAPYLATLKTLGATPAELVKFEELYKESATRRATLDANNPAALQRLLDYYHAEWTAEAAHPLLTVGSPMPQFSLKGVDGKTYSPASMRSAKAIAVVFVSNHCPASQMYEERTKALAAEFKAKGVEFLAIQADGPEAAAPSELGYTDVDDGLEGMKIRAAFRKYNYPYLWDGDLQTSAKAFGPKVTPHFFLFDQDRKLRYEGRIDNSLRVENATTHEARDAIEAVLAGKEVAVTHTPVFGCSMKWNDQMAMADRERASWAALPVKLETANLAQLTELRKTAPGDGKIRIVNFWATWCGPCKVEMPEIIKTWQWYRGRGVDLVTVSVDAPSDRAAVQKFLETVHSPTRNLQVDTEDLFAIQAAFDPKWESGVPLTLVLGPDGEVLYRSEGEIDLLKMRRIILREMPDRGTFAGNRAYWSN